MLPVNRQSILDKHYMQTFYKRSWDIVKRFDNVLKTLPNKCYYTLFIRPLKNVMKMLCVCWVHVGNYQIQTRSSRLWALTWIPRNYFAASNRTTSSTKLSEGFYLETNCPRRSWKIFPSHSSSTRIPVEDRGNTGWLSTSRVRITGNFFDSYGYPPEHLAEDFEVFLTRNVENWEHNSKKVQGDFSTVCRQFCLFYLYDAMVNRFVNDAYNANFETIDLEYLTDQIARPFIESLKWVA